MDLKSQILACSDLDDAFKLKADLAISLGEKYALIHKSTDEQTKANLKGEIAYLNTLKEILDDKKTILLSIENTRNYRFRKILKTYLSNKTYNTIILATTNTDNYKVLTLDATLLENEIMKSITG